MFTFQRRYRHACKIILIIESSINESPSLLRFSTVGKLQICYQRSVGSHVVQVMLDACIILNS